jgi:protein gp37
MSEHSAIEWTDATWNPTTGCTKVSPACAHCYIERTPPFRIQGRKFVKGHIPLVIHHDRLDVPKHWAKPRRVFVNSLSDLFHADVPFHYISSVWRTMQQTPQHVYQVLTKRPERMREVVAQLVDHYGGVLPNVWLGVSVENQRFADERIPLLLQTPAAVRFISAEPLLGEVNFRWAKWDNSAPHPRRMHQLPPVERGGRLLAGSVSHLDGLRVLDWIIVGGESGPRVRPTNPDWVRSIRDQCVEAGVPFFFKQWGGKTAKAGGRELDGRTWDEMPS